MTRVSEIVIVGTHTLIEIPNSDALLHLTEKNRQEFIANHGDVEIVKAGQFNGWWAVPAFAESRKLYSEAKARDCKIWGCE